MIENKEKPYLSIAAICQQVLQEKDEVLSGIRFIDTLTLTTQGDNPPEALPPFAIGVSAIVAFKSGLARGKRNVSIALYSPNGEKLTSTAPQTVIFQEDHQGVNIIMRMEVVTKLEGLYWFDVLMDEELVTRMPLRIIYAPDQAAEPEQQKK
ncbi:MAG TPA: hypothetical protein VGC91_16865 [Pyrinomonadaceae bacterium]|jgi:hypothetical protein